MEYTRVCDMCSGPRDERSASVQREGDLPEGWFHLTIYEGVDSGGPLHVPGPGVKIYHIDICDEHRASIEPFLKRYGK